jgi:group I intron endonuclease
MIVYAILNLLNGKRYVGLTKRSLRSRRDRHFDKFRNGTHPNAHLQSAWQEHGNYFVWVVLDTAQSIHELRLKEMFWIQQYCSHLPEFGYNKTMGGDGARHTAEGRAKLSARFKGKTNWWKGRKRSEATKKRMSQAQAGRTVNASTRKSLSDATALLWQTSAFRTRLEGCYPAFYNEVTGESIPAGFGLSAMCRERGLQQAHMSSVVTGKRKHHKGWVVQSEVPK